MTEGTIFSIEEFSTFDGPGIRTTVFPKGCPLRCSWCHNPEGQSFRPEITKAQSGCTGCGACLRAGEAETGVKCISESSIRACPNRLLRKCGEKYTPEELVKKLSGNFDILRMSGGGITFSGGEPLAQSEFLLGCLHLLNGQVHTAIQTTGYCRSDIFRKALGSTDYFLFDLKLADSTAHKRFTGVDNAQILENLSALCLSGKPFTVRTPLIPGVTDTEENIAGICRILTRHGISKIELLPYNTAAGGKYSAVGRTYQPDFDPSVPCNPRLELFHQYEITPTIL